MPRFAENVITIWHSERILVWLDKKISTNVIAVSLFRYQEIQDS